MPLNPSSFDHAEYLEPALTDAPIEPDSVVYPRALIFGLVGAALAGIVYAAFVGITHIQIGYLSIGVAYLVAKAMTIGSKERGGRQYQITAIILTFVAIAFGNALMLWWAVHKDGPVPLTLHNIVALAKYGFEEPFLEFQSSPVGAALGLFILFIGLRAAWRMTSGVPGAVRHPFQR